MMVVKVYLGGILEVFPRLRGLLYLRRSGLPNQRQFALVNENAVMDNSRTYGKCRDLTSSTVRIYSPLSHDSSVPKRFHHFPCDMLNARHPGSVSLKGETFGVST